MLVLATAAAAHPGAMDKNNCHKVHKDYKYKDGRVLKAGTTHCHPKIEDFQLEDGKGLVAEDKEIEIKTKPRKK